MTIPSLLIIKKKFYWIIANDCLIQYEQNLSLGDIDLLLSSGNKRMLNKFIGHYLNCDTENNYHYKFQVINIFKILRKMIKSIYLRKVRNSKSVIYVHFGIFSFKSFIKVFSFNKGGYSVI